MNHGNTGPSLWHLDSPGMVPGVAARGATTYSPEPSPLGKQEEGESAEDRRVTSVRGRAGEVRPRSGSGER